MRLASSGLIEWAKGQHVSISPTLINLLQCQQLLGTRLFFFLGMRVGILFLSVFLQLVFHVPTNIIRKRKAWERG